MSSTQADSSSDDCSSDDSSSDGEEEEEEEAEQDRTDGSKCTAIVAVAKEAEKSSDEYALANSFPAPNFNVFFFGCCFICTSKIYTGPTISPKQGVSHKNEWNKFNRQCGDRKVFPASLAANFLQSKLNLFREWLRCGGEWEKVQFNIERKVSEQRKVKKIRKGVKQRDLVATYGEKLLKCISFNFLRL